MKIQNLFTSGKMNKDLDERLVPQGEYRDALNVRVANSTGSDVGAIENALSNSALTSLELGSNAACIGAVSDDEDRIIYWFVKSDTGSYICYYDEKIQESGFILSDTRLLTNENPKESVLNFNQSYMIEGNILTDADNLKKFLYFTDGFNPPRKINIARAKSLDPNSFEDEDINVIVKPPLFSPSLKNATNDQDLDENNLKEKILMFAYRYVYLDEEKSALSPFSEIGFLPKSFSYDFIGAINHSMENNYNAIDVKYNTGSHLVKKIDIVFKESGNNNIYLAATIDKAEKKYDNDSNQIFSFKNNSIYKVLPEDEIYRLYDNVPLTAKTQEIISNRLVYGNYTENFNLTDSDGNEVILDLDADYEFSGSDNDDPKPTARSGRDYEIGVVYLDDYGRSTTTILSDNNHTFVPHSLSTYQNELTATISSKAPSFAKYYRFFVKQTQENDYHVISPITIYDDSDYTWIRLEGDDVQKIGNQEYLIVKADLSGPKANEIKVKILDKGVKSKNFLEDSSYTGPTQQESGYYIKINGYNVDINETSYTKYLISDFDVSSNDYSTKFSGQATSYIEGPFFYTLEDEAVKTLTVNSTYSGTCDRRYEIKIQESGTTDKFVWRGWDINQNSKGAWSSQIDCSTSPITLDTGITVSFGVTTGHLVGDKFTFNYKTDITTTENGFNDFDQRTYITLPGFPVNDESITPGSKIALYYKEYKGVNEKEIVVEVDDVYYSVNEYSNIEEWYWEEGYDQIIQSDLVPDENIRFRRGIYTDSTDSDNTFQITGASTDKLSMIIESRAEQPDGFAGLGKIVNKRAYATAEMSILKRGTDSFVVLETIPSKTNADVFYEIPGTYEINDCGYHLGIKGRDVDQTFNTSAKIYLNFFNAYTFSNGFECYKIRDAFISDSISIKNRPLSYVENYRKNNRVCSVTYSDVYEQSTNYNGLNEFNLAKVNYIDLDDEYGSIQKIHSRDTNLIVFQDNKVSQLLYNKSVIYNADGSGNVSQNLNIFGQQIPFVGEYGISKNPHSFSSWASRMYFADERRGAVLRLSQNGITEISQYGMRDWFRDNLKTENKNVIVGGYDPFTGQYVLSIKNPVEEWREDAFECDQSSCDLEAIIYQKTTTTTTTSTTTTTTTTAAPSTTLTLYADVSTSTNPLQGWGSSTDACAGTGTPITVYLSTAASSLQQAYTNGYTLYLDSGLTTPYAGNDTYFKDVSSPDSGNSLQVGNDGAIATFSACPAPPPPPIQLDLYMSSLNSGGWTQSGLACAGEGVLTTVYIDGSSNATNLYQAYQNQDVLYGDSNLSVPFIGQNSYFKTVSTASAGSAVKITSGGLISDYQDCAPGTTEPPTGSYNLFFCDTGIGAGLRVLDDGNIDPGMVIEHNGICYIVDTYSNITAGAFSDYTDYSDCQECLDNL